MVLTGAGDKVFCAGADLGGFAADVPLVAKHFATDLFLEYFRLMPRLGKPSLCAANGHVLAGGMGLALSCDLLIAKEGATFGTPEINVGAFPYMIMAIIYRNVPRKKVNEMMLLGERLSAEQAVEYGLANKVVPAARVRRRRRRLGDEAGLEEPGADAARPRRDVPPAGHGGRRRARLPALAALAHLLDRGHRRGRHRILRETRPAVERDASGDRARERSTCCRAPPRSSELTEQLHERREKAKLGGGEEKIAKQHERGKLTARERIDLLVDEGTFVEMGIHGRPHFAQRAMDGKEAPADGVITGWGDVDGRPCCIAAYDFTVMAGSMGMTGELKVTRLREMALSKRMPFIWLLDSAGARIQEAAGSLFAGSGHLFREEVEMSGVIPMVAAMMGPCAAGTAYIPALADFVPMVSGQGAMALAGPHLTKAVTGEDITMEELGGAKVHCRKSGVGDLEVKDDEECIANGQAVPLLLPDQLRAEAAGASRPPTPTSASRRS